MGTLIIFGFFMIISFFLGFYFGYLKREDKPPELPFKNVRYAIKKVGKDEEVNYGFYGQKIDK